jgi:predicted 3-demethylubiquinone-9 3-methyltransferase (glyoxalase superfamily)
MQKIVPNLWFDDQAAEAAEFYTSVFDNSKITRTDHYTEAGKEIHQHKPGSVLTVEFEILGYKFVGLNGGPQFKINPSVSFFVNFDPSQQADAQDKLNATWEKLSDGGKVLMPLDKYPFSERYGWIEDKFGVSWQLILGDPKGDPRPPIIPSLLFVGDAYGKAEEAIGFYLSTFKDTKKGLAQQYPEGMAPEKPGTLMFGDFMLENQWFAAADSAQEHKFAFNEAVSLMVTCQDQEEVDYYWGKLSAVPESEICGWLKDKYGVSWQIVPQALNDMLQNGTPDQVERVTAAFMQMGKMDIAKLQEAYGQK